MIKRRFYKQDHGDSDSSSSSSSEDSCSSSDPQEEEEEEVDEQDEPAQEEDEEYIDYYDVDGSKGVSKEPLFSGYESEDSSGNEIKGDSSDLTPYEEDQSMHGSKRVKDKQVPCNIHDDKENAPEIGRREEPLPAEFGCYILKCKSVFKCKLCPRIVCLNEKSVREHLSSKRHARSKKLLDEGRLKLMLNSDGELEEEQETHAERHARILALAQESISKANKVGGHQNQTKKESISKEKKNGGHQNQIKQKVRKRPVKVNSQHKEKGKQKRLKSD